MVLTSDVRWAVLMTKCDCAYEALKIDLGRIGNSRDILRIATNVSDKLGVNMANILFIKVSSFLLMHCIAGLWNVSDVKLKSCTPPSITDLQFDPWTNDCYFLLTYIHTTS